MERRAFLGSVATAAIAGCTGQTEQTTTTTTRDQYQSALPHPALGTADAPVTIEVFTDYACHYCRDYVLQELPSVFQKIVKPGKARYRHYDFPIPVNQWSWNIGYVARWIQAEYGLPAYWHFHQVIYTHFGKYGMGVLADVADGAVQSRVTREMIDRVVGDERYRETLLADKEYGRETYGVSGTPYVFVDGTRVEPTYQAIAEAVSA